MKAEPGTVLEDCQGDPQKQEQRKCLTGNCANKSAVGVRGICVWSKCLDLLGNMAILKDVCTTVVNSSVFLPFSLLWLSFFKCWRVYRTVCARRSHLVGFAPSQQVSMLEEVVEELWYNTFMMDGHYGYRNFDIMRQSINRKTHFAWVLHHPSWARCALIKVFLLSRGPPSREDEGTRPRLESNILASPLMWASEMQNVLETETNSNSSCIENNKKKTSPIFFSLRLPSSRLQKTKNHVHVLPCASTWPGVKPAVCAQCAESSLWLKAKADIHIFSLKSWNLDCPLALPTVWIQGGSG